MTDNINVKPGKGGTAVPVKTDVIEGVHVPIYKAAFGADGDLTLVDEDNPLPSENKTAIQNISAALNVLAAEQRLTNLYLSKIVGEDLRLDNELENR